MLRSLAVAMPGRFVATRFAFAGLTAGATKG
jgi:hypothetical protein